MGVPNVVVKYVVVSIFVVLLKLFCFADLQLEAVYVLTTACNNSSPLKRQNILRKFNGSMSKFMSPTLLLSLPAVHRCCKHMC